MTNTQQPSLFETEELPQPEWDSDSWETPDWLAQKMASLVLPTDRSILEPAAGTGQIVRRLPIDSKVVGIEIKPSRFQELYEEMYISREILCADFLNTTLFYEVFNLVITNPPFSKALEFIEQGLKCLDCTYEHARLLYLLPSDFCQSVARYETFNNLDCHIHHEYKIVNRVAYLKDGKPFTGRQCYDSVFEIRPGKQSPFVTFWS